MKKTPLLFKLIINFLAFLGYTLLVSVVFSFLYPLFLKIFWKPIPAEWDPIFTKIQISIALIVLIVTLIFRKYFYMSLDLWEEKISSIKIKTWDKKIDEVKIDDDINIFKIKDLDENESDDDIKIYVDKEIKR